MATGEQVCAVVGCGRMFVPAAPQQKLCEPNCRSRRRYGQLVVTLGQLHDVVDLLQATARKTSPALRWQADNYEDDALRALADRLDQALGESDGMMQKLPIERPE